MRLFILTLLLLPSFFYAQTFTKTYQFCESSSYSGDILETEAGEIIGVGGFDYKCQLLYKLNSKGELVDSLILMNRTIGSILFGSVNALVQINSDTFFYVATIREDDFRTADILITKFTGTPLDTLFTKRYKIDDYQQSFSITNVDQGFRIFCRTDSINNRGGSSKGTSLLLDIDKNGKLLNKIYYRDTFRFSGSGVTIQLPNKQTAIAYKTGNDDASFEENFVIIDSAYQLIWEKGTMGWGEPDQIAPQLVLSEDSTTIYYATQEWQNWPRGFHGYISAHNLDGSMIWEKFLLRHDFNLKRMVRAKNGDLIGCGFWWDQNERGRIFRLDKNGNVIFDRAYILPDREKGALGDYSEFLDISETKNGGLLVSGVKMKVDDLQFVAYILKLDSSGCLTPSCDSISYEVANPVSTKDIAYAPNQIQVQPNPASEVITFRLPTGVRRPQISVINAMGQVVVHQKELDVSATLKVGHLPKGMYFFEAISAEGKRIGSGKFVIER